MNKNAPNMSAKPLILAVETSGRAGSIAIAEGEKLLAEKQFSAPMRHSAEIFPAINAALEQFGREAGEIEHVYISVGPGSFTGLRIAVTMAKAMNLARQVKIVAVDTLDVIAANVSDYVKETSKEVGRIGVLLDAKRGEFFAAVYEDGSEPKKVVSDCVIRACDFVERFCKEPVMLLGEGLVYYRDKFTGERVEFFEEKYWQPKAVKVHFLGWKKALQGEFADALELQPSYLRRLDVKEKGR